MNKRFKEWDIVFLETSSYDGYYFKYIGIIKKHYLSKKICDLHASVAYERTIQECYENLDFEEEGLDYDTIRPATDAEIKLFANILRKDANNTKDRYFSTSKKSAAILDKYFKKQFKARTNITAQELIDKLSSIKDKSKEVFLLAGDNEYVVDKISEEIDTISIICKQ